MKYQLEKRSIQINQFGANYKEVHRADEDERDKIVKEIIKNDEPNCTALSFDEYDTLEEARAKADNYSYEFIKGCGINYLNIYYDWIWAYDEEKDQSDLVEIVGVD